MALRKDKVAAALAEMKGICSSPDDPTSLPDALGQLTDILGNVLDTLTVPELPQIDSGEFSLPEDEPFDFPLGGGDFPFFDPLGGFEGAPPGFGDEFGPGGEGGEGEGDGRCDNVIVEYVTFLAKTLEEMPAGENGNPGEGLVGPVKVARANQEQYKKCKKDIEGQYGQDISEAETNLHHAIDRGELRAPDGPAFETEDEAIKHWRKRIKELGEEYQQAIIDCGFEKSDDGPVPAGPPRIAKNISCEKIEKDTQVVVSGLMVTPFACGEDDDDDLYVMVEACGCD